jgi:hypothetical protein
MHARQRACVVVLKQLLALPLFGAQEAQAELTRSGEPGEAVVLMCECGARWVKPGPLAWWAMHVAARRSGCGPLRLRNRMPCCAVPCCERRAVLCRDGRALQATPRCAVPCCACRAMLCVLPPGRYMVIDAGERRKIRGDAVENEPDKVRPAAAHGACV